MRRISYAINGYHRTASIMIEYANPFVFLINKVADFVCGYLIPPLPLPNFNIVKEGEPYTIKEYYGNLSSLFCCLIHYPISNWCDKKTEGYMIPIDYDELRRACYDKEENFWKDVEERAREIKEDDEV